MLYGYGIQQRFIWKKKYFSRWKLFGHREISCITSENLPVGAENFLGLPQARPEEHRDKDLYYVACMN